MKKIISLFFRLLSIAVLVTLLLFSFTFAIMQTTWFKQKLISVLVQSAKEQGYTLKIEGLGGLPPFAWSIEKVDLTLPNGNALLLQNAKMRVALFPLFQKQLSISYLNVEKASYAFASAPTTAQQSLSSFAFDSLPRTLPFSFSSRRLHIRELILSNTATKQELALSIQGSAKVKQDLSEIGLELQVSSPSASDVYTKLSIEGSERKNTLSASLDLHVDSMQYFALLGKIPFDSSAQLKSTISGPWTTWKSLMTHQALDGEPLHIALTGSLSHLLIPNYPLLNRAWRTNILVFVYPNRSIELQKGMIESDLLQLTTKDKIGPDFTLNRLTGAFTLRDLSLFNSYLPLGLKGSLMGKVMLSDQIASFSLSSSAPLQIGKQSYESTSFTVEAKKTDGLWKGSSDYTMQNKDLTWKGHGDFTLSNENIQVHDLFVSAGGATVDGSGSYSFTTKELSGTLFAEVKELRPFRVLFPDSHLDGSLGANLTVSGRCSSFSHFAPTHIKAHVVSKNIRFEDKMASALLFDADLTGSLMSPKGSFSLEAKDMIYSDVFFSQIALSSTQGEHVHPFSLYMQGAWKEDMELMTKGSWSQSDSSWELHIDTLAGQVLKNTVLLEHPVTLKKSTTGLSLQELNLKVTNGTLFLSLDLSQDKADVKAKAVHFPLDIMAAAHPGFALQGAATLDGYLQISGQEKQGQLNFVLEQSDMLQLGSKESLHAKGSLQAHLQNNKVQVHAHVYASGQQFFDASATAPLDIRPFPFALTIDPKQPIAAELTTEGALEEIFDFINIGSHKASGLMTAHLFLSRTLEHPSVRGDVDWQQGAYENYFTGTKLHNIEAKAVAEIDKVYLRSFSAKDQDKGTLSGEGSLSLHPNDKFPFSLTIEMDKLNALRYEMIDALFTGPLYIKGNNEEALAQGNLLVPKAYINMLQSLPADVPVLDVTYINRPIHLQSRKWKAPKSYPVHLDIDLTAHDSVYVNGKGLSSEWKGNLHVTGTNTNIAASGTLSLVKGDYTFSGKKFSLTQGEIAFNDKPTPSAFLKLSGSMQLADLQVLAVLQGPLSSPTLTFQSIPHMPTSSILARILFNKDISEITALQAIQLANVIVSLSGGAGPDVLEAIRKSIGVDRLNIAGKDGTDEISVQIGWYLAHGVTVTLSQSATSSDVTIEVDLKHGFIFQAETQNQEEGKFSLKWNRNY